ncbi:MAG: energy transducer TonB [Magnetococcales bacterium]|nr:energy transducer TonB [Magnetococcales bacterium]
MASLLGSLLLHALVFWRLNGPVTIETPQEEIKFLPVELIQWPMERSVPKPPEKPDFLAQVNHETEKKQTVPQPPDLNLSESRSNPDNTNETIGDRKDLPPQQKIEEIHKKETIEKKTVEKKTIEKKTIEKKARKRAENVPARPLLLDPTLSDINQWEEEKNNKKLNEPLREQTLDLNTTQVEYAVYFARLKEQIEQGWIYPEQAKSERLAGSLRLKFTIDHAGHLVSLKILRSSGVTILDESALKAIRATAPFAPLPREWQLERVHVTTTFEYIRRNRTWKP